VEKSSWIIPRPPTSGGRGVDYESHVITLDCNELGALLVAAGLRPPAEHALISLLAFNGLRVSEETGADIEYLGLERRGAVGWCPGGQPGAVVSRGRSSLLRHWWPREDGDWSSSAACAGSCDGR
jgi:hypothetical protein